MINIKDITSFIKREINYIFTRIDVLNCNKQSLLFNDNYNAIIIKLMLM